MPPKDLPTLLTVENWNKNKGVIAKMHGETGIGAALQDLKVTWKKVDWNLFDPKTLQARYGFKDNNVDDAKAALAKAEKDLQAEFKDVEAVRKKLLAFNTLSSSVATKFKASKTIPASSRKLVEDMNKASSNLAVALKSIDQEWKAYLREVEQKEKAKYEVLLSGMETKFNSALTKADAFIAAAKKTPTVAFFNEGASKASRDLAQNYINARNAVQKGYLAKKPVTVSPAFTQVARWANSQNQKGDLPDTASQEDVLNAIRTLETCVREARAWLAS